MWRKDAVAYRFMTGGYPPNASVNKRADKIVFFSEKVFSLEEMIRLSIITAFQLRQGITMNEKYINDNMYGVIVVNKANKM